MLTSVAMMAAATYEFRLHQMIIEDGHRKQVGLFLHDNMKADAKVYLEPIGYIGYYSDRYVEDYPGLIAPQVAKLHTDRHRDMRLEIIPELMPEWMVLRDNEVGAAVHTKGVGACSSRSITSCRVFDVSKVIAQFDFLPGGGISRAMITLRCWKETT